MTPNHSLPTPHSFPASFTPEKQKELFEEIVRLYDLADGALAVIQKNDVPNRKTQLELATPFITQVINSANILTTYYNEVVNKEMPLTSVLKDTLESAFKNVFYALNEFANHAEEKLRVEDKE